MKTVPCDHCGGTGTKTYNTITMHCPVCEGGPYQKALRLLRYYQTTCGPGWGNLHVVIEDANLEDRNIYWSQGFCSGVEDYIGSSIMEAMAQLTIEERCELLGDI